MTVSTLIILSVTFTISLLCTGLVIVLYGRSRLLRKRENDLNSVQTAHLVPAPRIGGVPIVIAFIIGITLSNGSNISCPNCPKLLLSIIPIFIAGLIEDLNGHARPRFRLIAAAISGSLFVLLFGQWLLRTEVPGLDIMMQWTPFAIMFSLFVTVGISHSFNLIDGVNGLAGLTGSFAALALAVISHQESLFAQRDIMLFLSVAILAFLLFNYPFGKIFLGDAGAYVIGHVLSWTAISILWNAPQVSPWAILLIFFWPVADTLLAVIRRITNQMPILQPDRLHFHQLAMRALEITFLGRNKRKFANPLTTLVLLPFVISPILAGVFLATETTKATVALAIFIFLFIVTYKLGMNIARGAQRRRKF